MLFFAERMHTTVRAVLWEGQADEKKSLKLKLDNHKKPIVGLECSSSGAAPPPPTESADAPSLSLLPEFLDSAAPPSQRPVLCHPLPLPVPQGGSCSLLTPTSA